MAPPESNDGPFDNTDPSQQPALPPNNHLPQIVQGALVIVSPVPAGHDTTDLSDLAEAAHPDRFRHYVSSNLYQTTANEVRDAGKSEKWFWNVHSVGAYEYSTNDDNDPDNQGWFFGYSTPEGGNGSNLIYMETIRDVVAEGETLTIGGQVMNILPQATVRSITVAHEALHRFFGWHTIPTPTPAGPEDVGIMAKASVFGGPLTLTNEQFRIIQKTRYPR